ncbi:ABC transporter permease [Rubrobacter calidifluminis]|uniref:ABC transporter permease n=1 Tax=Rubrobacter calidifluminis TaxID=1392640 RepID=UPI002362B37C|nr:ABC transporter permease [Rubrobacter calidifluminis]
MVGYLARRALFGLLTLFFASVIIFFVVGTLGQAVVTPGGYAAWAAGLLRGDLGTSLWQHASVDSVIALHVWPTVLLMGSSLALTVIVAIPFGTCAAIKRGGLLDNAGRAFFFVGYSLPGFWLGAILQLVLGIYLADWAGTRVFYVSGISTPGNGGVVDLLQHLVLPVITLSAASVAQFVRFQRGAMVDALASDYVRAARAKGLGRRGVYLKHALRNALLPTVTLFALSMGTISGGAIVIEAVFSWPGLGFLFVDSLAKGDYEVIRALAIINAAFVIFFNLLADVAYTLLDPRISYGSEQA